MWGSKLKARKDRIINEEIQNADDSSVAIANIPTKPGEGGNDENDSNREDLNFKYSNCNIEWARSSEAQLEKMSHRYYRSNGPDNSKFTRILLWAKTRGWFKLLTGGKFIDSKSIFAHTLEGIRLRIELFRRLTKLNIDPRHIGAPDWSSLLSIPGFRGKFILPLFSSGKILRASSEDPEPEALDGWTSEMFVHCLELLVTPVFEPIKNSIGSYGGNMLNAADPSTKLRRIKEALRAKVKPTRLILALISRLQNDSSAKVNKRPGVDDQDKETTVDNRFSTILEEGNFPFLDKLSKDEIDMLFGQRHRTAYAACSYMTMLENFVMLPLMNGAYKKAEYLLKHRDREQVERKLSKKRHWAKMDMGNWDQTIPKPIIHAFIDHIAEQVDESHRWRYDAYKEGFVLNWITYDGKMKTALSDSDFNCSGWAFVSPLARFAMISFMTHCIKQVVPDFSYEQFYRGEGTVVALCEGDDSLIGCDDEIILAQIKDVMITEADKLALRLEFEDQNVFRGDNFDSTDAGHYFGYSRLITLVEKMLSPEYSLAARLQFGPIGHDARLEHARSNPSFDKVYAVIKDVFLKYGGADLDEMWEARKAFIPDEVLSFNAATIAFMEDPTVIYKGKGINLEDVHPSVLRRQFLNFNPDIVETMYNKCDFDALADYLEQVSLEDGVVSSDTTHMRGGMDYIEEMIFDVSRNLSENEDTGFEEGEASLEELAANDEQVYEDEYGE